VGYAAATSLKSPARILAVGTVWTTVGRFVRSADERVKQLVEDRPPTVPLNLLFTPVWAGQIVVEMVFVFKLSRSGTERRANCSCLTW
jgi:hypothetical protein